MMDREILFVGDAGVDRRLLQCTQLFHNMAILGIDDRYQRHFSAPMTATRAKPEVAGQGPRNHDGPSIALSCGSRNC